jgi:hypothetical protein
MFLLCVIPVLAKLPPWSKHFLGCWLLLSYFICDQPISSSRQVILGTRITLVGLQRDPCLPRQKVGNSDGVTERHESSVDVIVLLIRRMSPETAHGNFSILDRYNQRLYVTLSINRPICVMHCIAFCGWWGIIAIQSFLLHFAYSC